MTPASKMLTGRALLMAMPAEPDHPEIGDAGGENLAGDRDRGLGREDFAGAVDEDAVAHRLDAAAVDDRTGDSAVEEGNAGCGDNRAGVRKIAREATTPPNSRWWKSRAARPSG